MRQMEPTLMDLPPEILLHLIPFLSLSSIAALASTSKFFLAFSSLAFQHHATALCYLPLTDGSIKEHWNWSHRCRWAVEVSDRWSRLGGGLRSFTVGAVGRSARGIPVMRLWEQERGHGRVVVARGGVIEVLERDGEERIVERFRGGVGGRKEDRGRDISAVCGIGEHDLMIGDTAGLIQRVTLRGVTTGRAGLVLQETARYDSSSSSRTSSQRQTIQALSATSTHLFSLTSTRKAPTRLPAESDFITLVSLPPTQHLHKLSVHRLSSPWLPPSFTLSLPTKPWCLLIPPSSSTSWLVIGSSASTTPISAFSLSSNGEPTSPRPLRGFHSKTSVYALSSPTLSSFLPPESTLVSASYNSTTQVYDLRSPVSRPILVLHDPLNDDPCYSVSTGGPTGSYVAVGMARNSTVRLFDLRKPGEGVNIFAPGKERSPVYGVKVEYSGIWGTTQGRSFFLDFEGKEGGERVKWFGIGEKGMRLQS